MLKEKVLKALNEQVNAEQYSALLYLSMSAWFEDKGLPGFANWMYVQYQEELTHANKIFKYIVERSGKAEVKAIKQMPADFESVLQVVEKTLEHEQHVTDLINNLVDVASEERDHATQSFLQWFVDEQVEEEANVTEILDSLKLIEGEGKGNGLFMLDRELRQRTFVDTTQTAE
ncbi:ferritin [Mariniphaga sp.]|uniref:ferritin n=1 Tax=Mariniphaga sp. TaxID=1954475 RepID=UPI0035699578